jgi:Protein of unknown function (DUF3237)
MIELVPLCTVELQLAPNLGVGVGPAGDRSVGEIRRANIVGERLRASLAGPAAADWLVRTGAIGVVDARMTLRTDDGALILVRYGGRLDLSNPGQGMFAYVAPVFETGDARYAWLNRVQAVGKGQLFVDANGGRLTYEFYEIR